MIEAAVDAGYHTFGVTEHAPRLDERYLYDEEKAMGWDVAKLERDFEAYCADIQILADEFDEKLTVLRGFEAEVVPEDRWLDIMQGYRDRPGIDFVVGSVHFLHGVPIDGPPEFFEQAMNSAGGLEPLALQYYEAVGDMVDAFKPEVVGHLDLIKKNGHKFGDVETDRIREAASHTVDRIRDAGSILDLNTAGWRKGLPTPYPAPWLVELCAEKGAPFCFGDDSHCIADVGAGLDKARQYLLDHGVATVTVLTRENGQMVKREVAL